MAVFVLFYYQGSSLYFFSTNVIDIACLLIHIHAWSLIIACNKVNKCLELTLTWLCRRSARWLVSGIHKYYWQYIYY